MSPLTAILVLCGVTPCGVTPCGVTPCVVTLCGVTPCVVTPCGVFTLLGEEAGSVLCVPVLQAEGVLVGVVELVKARNRTPFTPQEEEVM